MGAQMRVPRVAEVQKGWAAEGGYILRCSPHPVFTRDSIPISCLPHSQSSLLFSEFTLIFISLATTWFPTPASLIYMRLNSILRVYSLLLALPTIFIPAPEVRTGQVCTLGLIFLSFIFNPNKNIIPSLPQSRANSKFNTSSFIFRAFGKYKLYLIYKSHVDSEQKR